ncbi:heme-dependent oxidative N-demethylase family protein [Belnapia moabensis]|uniref:heme-dependent oxidative N-demethylase family protein n=1 Tax=Belnapia moabensis TaxID=365533 RepID=UPI0005BB63F6|nr:DUF3445 domain-containing protein [Belnapia moabensis]
MDGAELPREVVYLPFEDGPFRMAMGLVSCPEADWIEIDERYPAEMAERWELLATRHEDVFAACPGSEAARAEVLALLAAHLPARFPTWFQREGHQLRNRLTGEEWDLAAHGLDPLELAARLVQEDLCIIRPAEGGPVLEAGLLCAPTRWRITEKVGRPLMAVHAAVPFYGERLGVPVDRFMGQIKAGRVAMRVNWSVVDSPALFQLEGKHRGERDPSFTAENAGERLHLRTERQTFRRLPESGAVLFTIRVHSYPLTRVAALPGVAKRLAGAVRALPEEMGRYKSLPVYREALLAWLDAARPATLPGN